MITEHLVASRSGFKKFPIVIIGIGNHYRSDDAVGLTVAQYLRAMNLPDIMVMEERGESVVLMERWKDAHTVIVVDAIRSGMKPGTIHRLDAHVQPIPATLSSCSTHSFSIADSIEIARTLNLLPPCLIVYGVEGKSFEAGIGLSPEVQQAAEEVVRRVVREIPSNLQKPRTHR